MISLTNHAKILAELQQAERPKMQLFQAVPTNGQYAEKADWAGAKPGHAVITGRNLVPGDAGFVNGRPAKTVWLSTTELGIELPSDIAAGAHQIDVYSSFDASKVVTQLMI